VPFDGEEDHCLHAHRLDDIQGDRRSRQPFGAAVVARLGDVLRPQAEDQFLADDGPVAGLARSDGTGSAIVSETCVRRPEPACSRRQGMKFIAGEPMNPATNRVRG
jgi:hypothetical protein